MTDLPSMLMPIRRRDRNGNEIRPGMRLTAHGCTMYIVTVPTLYAVLDRGSSEATLRYAADCIRTDNGDIQPLEALILENRISPRKRPRPPTTPTGAST